jgi:hypothetical protein
MELPSLLLDNNKDIDNYHSVNLRANEVAHKGCKTLDPILRSFGNARMKINTMPISLNLRLTSTPS